MKMPERAAGSSQAMGAALGSEADTGRSSSNTPWQPLGLGYRLQQAAAGRRALICRGETGFRGKCGASYGRTTKSSQNHKMKITQQASKHTSLEESFTIWKLFHRIEIFMVWLGFVFFNFLAAVLSLKKTTSRHSWGKQRPSLGLNVHQESLHLK